MKKLLLLVCCLLPLSAAAQFPVILHSHNDYVRTVPFWEAYSQHCASIEADVFLQDGEILVAHNREDLKADFSLRKVYIEPIVSLFRGNGGHMWENSSDRLILMVDLKAADAMPGLVTILEEYPDVFGSPEGVQVVVSGDVIKPEEFDQYPSFIYFDGRFTDNYTPEQLSRVGMISADFRDFAHDLMSQDTADHVPVGGTRLRGETHVRTADRTDQDLGDDVVRLFDHRLRHFFDLETRRIVLEYRRLHHFHSHAPFAD